MAWADVICSREDFGFPLPGRCCLRRRWAAHGPGSPARTPHPHPRSTSALAARSNPLPISNFSLGL